MEDARYLNDWMPIHMVDLLEEAVKQSEKSETKGISVVNSKLQETNSKQNSILFLPFRQEDSGVGLCLPGNSDDARNTPAVPFVLELERRGASFIIHDTLVKETEEGYKIEPDLSKSLKGCDALVLLTKHDEYKSLTPAKLQSLLKRKIIVDGRNLFDPEAFIKAGFVFKGVGKGNLNK